MYKRLLNNDVIGYKYTILFLLVSTKYQIVFINIVLIIYELIMLCDKTIPASFIEKIL